MGSVINNKMDLRNAIPIGLQLPSLECTNVALYGAVIFVYLLAMVLLSNSLQRLSSSYQSLALTKTRTPRTFYRSKLKPKFDKTKNF